VEKDTVRDTGLEPRESGAGTQEPQDSPGKQGADTVPAQEIGKLYRELKKWREKYRQLKEQRAQVEEREGQLRELKSRLAEAHLGRLLVDTATAQDAINPEQVAAMLRDRVSLGDDLEPVVAAPEGDEGGPSSVEELVSEFLSRYPYHRRAKISGGSGSAPSPSAAARTLKEQIMGAGSHDELEKIVSRKQP